MTEAQWQACADPQAMLRFLLVTGDALKLRLFVAACCWRLVFLLSADQWAAVEAAERVADGLATTAELAAARAGAPRGRTPAAVSRSNWCWTSHDGDLVP
jgi:hypothetical protein